jgi:hypothetical protein
MKFENGAWVGAGGALIGADYLASGLSEPIRKWTAHRAGTLRIEGTVAGKEVAAATILHNDRPIWPMAGAATAKGAAHDLRIAVKEGDTFAFIVQRPVGKAQLPVTRPAIQRERRGGPPPSALMWDPVITYVDP